jgi:integrase
MYPCGGIGRRSGFKIIRYKNPPSKKDKNGKVLRDKNGNAIKTSGKTWQRLDRKFYKKYLTSIRELKNLCIYLNGLDPAQVRAEEKYHIKLAYIPKKAIEEFQKEMIDDFVNDDKKGIKSRINAFTEYGLWWFQNRTVKLQDWKDHEKRWGKCLLNLDKDIQDDERIFPEGELRSKNTIVRVIWMMNHFLEFIHLKYPHKFPHLKMNPIKKQFFTKLQNERKKRNLARQRRKIDDLSWKKIRTALEKKENIELRILILCWEFGLRRNEALSLTKKNMKQNSLYIDEQLKLIDQHGQKVRKQTKNKRERHVPYSASPTSISKKEVSKIIREAPPIKPFTITKRWRLLLDSLKIKTPYTIHELRHTFAYNLVNNVYANTEEGKKNFSLKECMDILEHSNISTTNGYIQSSADYSMDDYVDEDEEKNVKKLA